VLKFKGSWVQYLPLIEFSYNNNYQETIGMPPYEALYEHKSYSPLYWDNVGERKTLGDKCFLVLMHTPLFMLVGPLALLRSNKFTCFYCFVINRSLHQILTKGAKVDLKPSEEVDPCQVCSNALTVAHRE
jgi:hypothetical protein